MHRFNLVCRIQYKTFSIENIPRLNVDLQNQKLDIPLDITSALNQNQLNFLDY